MTFFRTAHVRIPSVLVIIVLSLSAIYYGLPLILRTPSFLLRIVSDSMTPALMVGDRVLVSGWGKDDTASLVGEVIAFYDPTRGQVIVHRAIDRKGECLVTKGDNAQMIDFFQPCPAYLYGRVIADL